MIEWGPRSNEALKLRRRYFRLTARGKELLRRQMGELDDLVRYARGLGLVESR